MKSLILFFLISVCFAKLPFLAGCPESDGIYVINYHVSQRGDWDDARLELIKLGFEIQAEYKFGPDNVVFEIGKRPTIFSNSEDAERSDFLRSLNEDGIEVECYNEFQGMNYLERTSSWENL